MGFFPFVPAPIPPGDYERSCAARSAMLLMATETKRLTGIVKVAKRTFTSRWSGICVIVDDWQHVIASSGGMLGTYRRATAISSYAIAFPDEPFCILDAAADDRFAGNPFVFDGYIRFFVAAPIWRTSYVIGALCVTDLEARTSIASEHIQRLTQLAASV